MALVRTGFKLDVGAACTGCGACLPTCPEGAVGIVVSRERASQPRSRIAIDHLLCTGCFECVEVCPVGAINDRIGIPEFAAI